MTTAQPPDADEATVLDNLAWFALTTRHRHLSEGTGAARRYHADVAMFVGLESTRPTAWADLARVAGPGADVLVTRAELPDAPDGWIRVAAGFGHQLVLRDPGRLAAPDARIVPVGPEHIDEILALVALTKPGPFGRRTIEMGSYFGVFDEGRLVALAGERLGAPGYTEVSAVCTHPDRQRRGLASALTSHVARLIRGRGETPLLHVAETNHDARVVYERLGFEHRARLQFTFLRTPT